MILFTDPNSLNYITVTTQGRVASANELQTAPSSGPARLQRIRLGVPLEFY